MLWLKKHGTRKYLIENPKKNAQLNKRTFFFIIDFKAKF